MHLLALMPLQWWHSNDLFAIERQAQRFGDGGTSHVLYDSCASNCHVTASCAGLPQPGVVCGCLLPCTSMFCINAALCYICSTVALFLGGWLMAC
jgi:hypothetical protein